MNVPTRSFRIALLALFLAIPAAQASDLARKGEILFQRRCVRCHTLDEKGDRKLGPFLGRVYGARAGSADSYPHSEAYRKAGDLGLIWTEDTLVPYMRNPKGFLADFAKDESAESRMVFKLANENERKAIAAFLHSLSEDESAEAP